MPVPPFVEPAMARADADRRAAFERYVVPELEVLYRVARAITRDPVDAEDLVQETLLRAYRAADRFDGRHPRAWLLTIMRNAQVNRTRRRRPQLLADHDEGMQRVASTAADDDPERAVLDPMFDHAVARAFRELPEKFGKVIELVDLGGLSYADAAASLDIPVGTVMSRLHRGRARIRNALEEAGATPLRYRDAAARKRANGGEG